VVSRSSWVIDMVTGPKRTDPTVVESIEVKVSTVLCVDEGA
jgi:hypothetical protein